MNGKRGRKSALDSALLSSFLCSFFGPLNLPQDRPGQRAEREPQCAERSGASADLGFPTLIWTVFYV